MFYNLLVSTLLFSAVKAAFPGIPDIPGIPNKLGSLELPKFPKFPTLENELFKFPGGISPPRILLNFLAGIPTLELAIGKPPQKFIAIFDTATPITYVISDKCNSTICQSFSESQKFHVEKSSSNFQFPFQIDLTYLDGSSARLKPEFDSVTFADLFTFKPHLIAEAYQIENSPSVRPPISARLGVGNFGSINWMKTKLIYDGPNPFAAFTPPGILPGKRAEASDRYSTGAAQSGSGSSSYKKRALSDFAWIFGVDKALYTGEIYDISLISLSGFESPFWKMEIKSLQFRNSASPTTQQQEQRNFLSSGSLKGQIFSSSPDLIVPPSISEQMNRALGGTYDSSVHRWSVSCNLRQTGPDLIFQFEDGVTAEIPARQYIAQENNGCYSLINAGSTEFILLGGPFFQSFYIVYQFSARKIGLANSIAQLGKVFKN